MTQRAPASAAHLEMGLLPAPQFEAEFSSQRPKGAHKLWVEFMRTQACLDGQLHEAPDFSIAERFKGVLG